MLSHKIPLSSTLYADVILTVNLFAMKQGPGGRTLLPVEVWHDSMTGILPLKKRAKLVARKSAPSLSAIRKDATFAYYELAIVVDPLTFQQIVGRLHCNCKEK